MSAELNSPIARFAARLVSATSRDDLLYIVPDAFAELMSGTICTLLPDDEPDAQLSETNQRNRTMIDVRFGEQRFGVLAMEYTARYSPSSIDHAMLDDAIELTARAFASREQIDAEREKARAEAAELKFDMIGMLAHEMRTPLASIKGYSSALMLDEIDWEQSLTREFIQAIHEESDRLTDMVNHLLDSTVIEAGVLELNREPVLLSAVLRRAVEKMSHRTDRHRLVTSISDDFPVVFADEGRVQQVLSNLIDNAIKYSPDGGLIIVSGEVVDTEVLIRVSDQGVGIAPQHLNKLFERFFRTEQRKIHGVRGTGLGLPIADAIVRAHGGRIWAESVVDEGTTLAFTLPIDRSELGTDDND